MTPQGSTQSGACLQVTEPSETQRSERLVQFGCRLRQPERAVTTASVAFSEDDARLALIIFAKVQH